MAASEGRKDVVDYLIEEGANVNTKRDDGDNPLMAAARKGNLEIVTSLVEHGADVSQADNFGRTPLMMAARASRKWSASMSISTPAFTTAITWAV